MNGYGLTPLRQCNFDDSTRWGNPFTHLGKVTDNRFPKLISFWLTSVKKGDMTPEFVLSTRLIRSILVIKYLNASPPL